ncbi:hypothetical protein [Absidia glauca]|uniref:Uncharacterized protein n=1 Tax=Absidia glauca TaxID=4829 RepID=A0A168NBK7_ABSGL|nr:hypothetical protein [Absidia glauca]
MTGAATRHLTRQCTVSKSTTMCVWRTVNDTLPRPTYECKRYSSQHKGQLQPDEYELRVGYAITILQDELPQFFTKGLVSHDIYSQHVVLSDPHYTRLSIKGKTAYLGIAEMLRWSLGYYFDNVDFEIIRMRVVPDKPSDPPSSSTPSSGSITPFSAIPRDPLRLDLLSSASQASQALSPASLPAPSALSASSPSSTIVSYNSTTTTNDRPSSNVRSLEIRWQLKARPHTFFPKSNPQHQDNLRQVDGVFVYTFDSQGYICEHEIKRIEPTPSRTILLMHSYGGRLRAFLEALKRRNEPELRPGLGI